MRKRAFATLMALGLLILVSAFVYRLPPVYERLSWRVDNLRAQVRYALNPPEQTVFLPQEQDAPVDAPVPAPSASPPAALTPTAPDPSPQAGPPTTTPLPSPTATATPTPTPLPEAVSLTGIVHEYQRFNNCGPANLSMALSYWGWEGDQYVTRDFLRPSHAIDDKNVNPSEMVDFVQTQTGLQALSRVGGDLDTLRRFTAAGFPVIIEKGLQLPNEYWLGHFQIISGYDQASERFYVYDSYIGPDTSYAIPYAEVKANWPHFNNIYVVIFPPEREAEVLSLLGPDADPQHNFETAANSALVQAAETGGRDQFFAWFNRGTNLVSLEDYAGAAQAYDNAFAIYAGLGEAERPWRMLWYQTGPYPAYFHTGRFQDVINLAQTTLTHVDKPVLEETYYWRGLAKEALGDLEGAIADLTRAANLNRHSTDAVKQLRRLGVENPSASHGRNKAAVAPGCGRTKCGASSKEKALFGGYRPQPPVCHPYRQLAVGHPGFFQVATP